METTDDARSESLQESDTVVKHKPCPENNANLFSRIFLTWVFPLVLSGWRNPLKDEDLWELPDKERGVGNTNDLLAEWKVRDEKGGNNRLSRALLKNNRRILTFTFVLKAMTTTLNLVQPIFVNRVINFIQEGKGRAPIGVGIGWALSLLFAPLLFTIAENQYFLGAFRAGMRVRAGVQGIIYDKSLRMSPSARAGSSLGEIVNLMQLDSQRVGDFMQFLHILWSAPIQLIVSFALLFYYLEWSAVVGLVVTILTFPLQGKLMQVQIRLRKKSLGITDRRVKLMNEILQGIKAVKFYAWEEPFGAQVEKERKEEVENFSKTIWARSLFMAIMLSIPSIIAVVTFSFYAGVFKKRLVPDTVFTGVVVLNTLRQPVMLLPMVVNFMIDARLSIKRIERFLDLDNTDDYARQASADSNSKNNGIDTDEASSSESQNGDGAEHHETSSSDSATKVSHRGKKSGSGRITITDASFSWGTPGPSIAEVTSSGKSKSPLNCFGKKKRHEDSPSVKEEKNIEEASPGTGDATGGQDPSEAGALMVLQDISLDLSPGQLTAVIGRVGAGKSSLVQAILGEMQKASGEVKLEGSVAYVAQSAWIFNSTLKENILFGKPYNERLYRRALRVSALDADIAILPAGDMTAIGEKGINLSGGQKQRVSIARAVYADADVYLFDDPLSALDSHVSQEVFDKCLSNKGVLRNKLRLLVTNQVHVLGDCDTIVFLENGRIRNMGHYKYLAKSDSSFQQLIDEQSKKENDKEAENQTGQSIEESAINENSHAMQTSQSITEGQAGSVSISPESVQKDKNQTDEAKAGMKLIEEEDRKTGNIVANAYYQYAIACGGLIGFSILMVFWAATVALQVIGQWWLAYWTTEQTRGIDRGLGFYLGIYFALAIGYAILATLRSVWYLTVALYASKRLHKKMLGSVLHAPMSFFDTTPIGRIISRFSRDVQAVDELLPQFFSQMLTTVLNLIASYIYIGAALPPFFAVAIPVTIGYWGLQRFFNRTSLEVKRLDNISKSPIYAHFSETLSGLSTLRAYRKQDEYRAQNMEMIDINQRAFFAYVASNRWFSLYLELLGALLIFATALFGVVLRDSTQNVALIGLALSYALQVTGILGFSVRSITELEAQMSSVERLNHYAENLPQEAKAIVDHDDLSDDDRPPQGWPAHGSVNIQDVEMRYREGLDLVLKGVSVNIKGGEKVGVVGRTGSGKSSLMVAILRLVELAGGAVRIDGVNLANLGLDEVRKTVTIIPQDAVLFSGTVRFNLDPFGHYSEPELWDALAKSHLKDFVQDFEGGLDAVVAEYGENLSAGQRQLICLTRALLRKSKVLILDEASSSLDMETDRLIQETIRLHLKDATILTIAHRLFTLADYDKILVMDDGSVAEFGTPAELLAKKESRFSAFVDALGEEGARRFHELVASSAHE